MARRRQGYGAASAVLTAKARSASAVDKAVRAQGGAVVKPHQVRAMILAAHRAYQQQSKLGLVDDGVDFDAWRRATLHDVVGAAAPSSFRAVTQRDYAAVLAYFGELAGDDAAAQKVTGIRTDDERRRALWALEREEWETAEAFGGVDGARRYADSLFEKIHRTSRVVADARQIWAVTFTLRNRARARAQRPATPKERAQGPAVAKAMAGRPATPGRPAAAGRTKTALGARGAFPVPSSPPGGSERFPVFSRAL